MADDITAELDPESLRQVLAEVREFEPKLATALRKNLRVIGGEIVTAMQAEVRSAPSKGRGSHSTRAEIAAGLGVAVKTGKRREGVFITGSARKMAPGRAAMPRAMNKNQWRHPIFGTSVWVSQRGHPYFGKSITPYEEKAAQAIEDALDEALATVRSGTPT